MATSLRLIPIVVLILVTLGADKVQAEAVCSNTPTAGQWIECTEDATSTDDIAIDLKSGVNITTTGERDHGILGHHEGAGDITINVNGAQNNKTITTGGLLANGVSALSKDKGSVDITVTNVDITTTGEGASGQVSHGVSARQDFGFVGQTPYDGTYNVKIKVSDSQINTAGTESAGIIGYHDGNTGRSIINRGNLEITANNTNITTTGDFAHGIYALAPNTEGDVILTVTGGLISTAGHYAHGIYGINGGGTVTGESGNVIIHVKDAKINTTYNRSVPGDAYGIEAYNRVDGEGDVTVTLINTDISTMGPKAEGIRALRQRGDGDVLITIQGGQITTNHSQAYAIFGWHDSPAGDINIDLTGVTVKSEGKQLDPDINDITAAHAIYARARDGDINIDARSGTAISTKGTFSYGLRAFSAGAGDIQVTTHNGSSITNTGTSGHGIDARNTSTDVMDDTRSITITVGGDITASGENAHGVRIGTGSGGFVGLDKDGYRRQTVTVNGRVTGGSGTGAGIYLSNGGKVFIGPQGSIDSESGIAILATGVVPEDTVNMTPAIKPKLRVDMNLGGRRVAQALGENWILNDGGETTIAVNGTVLHDGAKGVTGRTASNGAWNVRMRAEGVTVNRTDPANWVVTDPAENVIADRDFSAQDFNERRKPPPPPPPPPPPMRQTVMVDERVFGGPDDPAGVYLPAGGEVYIGPEGSVGAESRIAILATGDSPKLLVDMNLNGRRVAEVIADDWIINDGGETTIVVNDVTLHNGATGVVPDTVALNGAWNVRMRAEGVTVTDYTTDPANGPRRSSASGNSSVTVTDRTDPVPANWVVSEPATGVIADRDFSAEDFLEEMREQPGSPVFMEEYAPRAAVYEALPDFLLRLTGQGPSRTCGSVPDEPVWVRFAGGQGSYEADRSTTGATYDLERFETEGGLSAAFNDTTKGWVSVRHLWGAAGIGSPTGGGQIDVRGLGSSVGGAWQSPTGAYAKGCFSYMAYTADFASNQQGLLKAGTNGRAYTLDVEAGRRFALTGEVQLTPRVWVVGSRVTVNSFTDTVDARVSFADANRIIGGLGFVADTTRPWGEGEFLLRSSVDVERLLSGVETRVQVSGERLSAEATEHSLRFGLNGVYRQGRFSIGAEVAARQELGSNDSEYASFLNVGISF